jgi:uncharacterized phage protein gp47/JayE
MPLFAESEEKIFGEVMLDIVNNTNLRRASPGSKTRAVAQALSRKMGRMYQKFDINIAIPFLDGAEGKYLDFLGDMMATPRLGETPAKVSSQERNVRFYVDTGTFATINGGEPILLTQGTIISTNPDATGVTYIVPYNVILSGSDSQAYVAAQSTRAGSTQNVGAKQLVYHNFSSYSDASNETLKVTNDAEVITGQSVETDTNYRFRIANKVTSAEQANLTAIRIAALSVPGVADLVFLPFHRGIGTFDMLIKATTPTASDGLIAAVQEAVDAVTAQGIVGTIRKPRETGMSLTASVSFKKALSSAEQQTILTNVTNNLVDYINNLDIGEEFIVNEALERAMATSADIKNVGSAGKPFDSIYLYKQTKLEDNKVRSTVLGDVTPKTDERLIVENQFAGTTPILVRVAV